MGGKLEKTLGTARVMRKEGRKEIRKERKKERMNYSGG